MFCCSSRDKPALGLGKQRALEDIVRQADYLVPWQVQTVVDLVGST